MIYLLPLFWNILISVTPISVKQKGNKIAQLAQEVHTTSVRRLVRRMDVV